VVRQSTAKSRFARSLASVSDWCRHNLHLRIAEQQRHLGQMMRGHYAYYGITGNGRRLRWYAHQVERIWQKWLSRRGQPGAFQWKRLHELLKRHPLPSAKIVHRYAVVSEALP
jgi:RNA-directed DNA polymerase